MQTMAKTYRFGSGPRFINRLFRVMTRLGLGAPYRHVLTVRGRKTGRPYSIPVDVVEFGGDKWLVAPYGVVNWVRNVRASGEVTLTRGSHSDRFRVEEVGVPEAVLVLRNYLSEVPVTRPYFDAAPDSPDEAIAAELPKHPVFRLIPLH
jgi:deazaflavin-dependent oxidoreductase (nitroreductase family)